VRIIKTIRQGLIYKTYYQDRQFRFSVGALSYFRLDEPRTLGTEPEMWATIAEELDKDAIFDFGMPKPHSEVLVYGECCAPSGKTATQLPVDLVFNTVKKRILVYGNRSWTQNDNSFTMGWHPSAPEPFEKMRIGWSNAYGAPEFEDNPFGKGHISPLTPMDQIWNQPLPNVESTAAPSQTPKSVLQPAGMGAIEMMWPQRIKKAGKYNKQWFENEYPGFPADMDYSFFNAAPSDQQLKGFLKGSETFRVTNMHPERPILEGALPDVKSRCFVHVRDSSDVLHWMEIPLRMETVWLFPTRGWGIVLQRGVVQVGTFLGSDVETLLLAYEYVGGESRTPQQYLESVNRRDDEEISMYWSSREDDLRPPESPMEQEELEQQVAEAAEREASLPQGTDASDNSEKAPEAQAEGMGLREYLPPRLSASEKAERDAVEKAKKEAAGQEVDLSSAMPTLSPEEERSKLTLPTQADDPHCQAALMDYLQQNHAYGEELFATVLTEDEADVVALTALAEQTEEAARDMCAMYGIDMDERRKESEMKFFDIDDAFYEAATVQWVEDYYSYDGQPYFLPLRLVDDDYVIANAIVIREERKVESLAHEHGIDLEAKKEEAKKNEKQALADLAAPLRDMRKHLQDNPAELKKVDAAISEMETMQPDIDSILADAEEEEHAPGAPTVDRRMVELMHQKGEPFDDLDLTGVNLSGLDLAGASFLRANLTDSNLTDTVLNGVDFTEAVLDGADFSNANASGARFCSAQMEKSVFHHATLEKASFESSALMSTRFISCQMMQSVLTADTIEKCIFIDCNLTEATLSASSFFECSLKNSVCHNANCEGADFYECTLEKTDFTGGNLKETSFIGVSAPEMRCVRATMTEANAHLECDFSRADFHSANMELSSFGGVDMRMANLRGANLTEADFSQTQLQESILDGAVARQTSFIEANLQGASMIGIDLLRASIEGANLKYAKITRGQLFETEAMFANTHGTDFRRTKIERTRFKEK
jgi:uncharacterized protein YjbI with pentapeptide repeats